MKTFKEYTGVTGIRIGGIDSVQPMASLGDKPPKGKILSKLLLARI